MTEVRIPLENHGPFGSAAGVRVEDGDEGNLYVTFDGETAEEAGTVRTLTPGEARALGSVLRHFATFAGGGAA